MNVTDLRLVVAVGAAAAAAVAYAVTVWRRQPRPRVLLRAGAVLLAELLVVTAAALVVNRVEDLYPTWAALGQRGPVIQRQPTTPGRLDATIGRLARGSPGPVALAWRPAFLASWPHAAATVVTPADYPQHPEWRYPAVLVLSSTGDGWTDATVLAAARRAGPAAVVVAVRVPGDGDPSALALQVAPDLERDVRVTGHHWGLVASAGMQPVARNVVGRDAVRFPVLAVAGRPGEITPAQVGPPSAALPAGVLAVRVGPANAGTATEGAAPQAQLVAALHWVGTKLPAPLAAPASVLTPPAAPRPKPHRAVVHGTPTPGAGSGSAGRHGP
ncbi:hypothetical protein [Micromonospora sp. NBC_00617]|uniref:hypothetical protein n=1 Tax=Micromonospora sp. NBC_00617 TaxID=2903587 RepID=UPI0030E59FCE